MTKTENEKKDETRKNVKRFRLVGTESLLPEKAERVMKNPLI